MDPFVTCVQKPNTTTSPPWKAHPAKPAHWELKVLSREPHPKINVSFATRPNQTLLALSMCKTTLLSRSGLVLGDLAPNVLLFAQVEPNYLATAMVNATRDQQATGHARVTRITLVLRAAKNAIATRAAATMAHLVMELARASQAPMVVHAVALVIAT